MPRIYKLTLAGAVVVACFTAAVQAADGTVTNPNDLAAVQHQKPPAACRRRLAQDFVPMTLNERIAYAVKSVTGPKAFLFTGVRAGLNHWRDEPPEWGQGAAGYGRRYGSAYEQLAVRQGLLLSSALILHEDNRYFASGEQGFGRRLRYAISSAFLARHDDGSRHLSLSEIGSTAGAAFISRAWQPPSTNTAGDGAISFGFSMAARVGFNTVREFLPRRLARFLP
jgi:hypothetical protein